MDWLRNWKKELLLSVMTGMLAVTLLFGGTKNVEDCSIMAWWGTLYPQFCFERGSQNSANYENTVKQPPKLSFWLAKAWRGGKIKERFREAVAFSESYIANRT